MGSLTRPWMMGPLMLMASVAESRAKPVGWWVKLYATAGRWVPWPTTMRPVQQYIKLHGF